MKNTYETTHFLHTIDVIYNLKEMIMRSLYLLLIPVFLIEHGGEKHEEKKRFTK